MQMYTITQLSLSISAWVGSSCTSLIASQLVQCYATAIQCLHNRTCDFFPDTKHLEVFLLKRLFYTHYCGLVVKQHELTSVDSAWI